MEIDYEKLWMECCGCEEKCDVFYIIGFYHMNGITPCHKLNEVLEAEE